MVILIEELAWRWLFFHLIPYNELTRLVSAFCFGYLHIFNLPPYKKDDSLIFRFITGPCYVLICMYFGYLITEHRYSLITAWLIHGLNNLIVNIVCIVVIFHLQGIGFCSLISGIYRIMKQWVTPRPKPLIVQETEPYNE